MGGLAALAADDDVRRQLSSLSGGRGVTSAAVVAIVGNCNKRRSVSTGLPRLHHTLPGALVVSLKPVGSRMHSCISVTTRMSSIAPFVTCDGLLLVTYNLGNVTRTCSCTAPFILLPSRHPRHRRRIVTRTLVRRNHTLD